MKCLEFIKVRKKHEVYKIHKSVTNAWSVILSQR